MAELPGEVEAIFAEADAAALAAATGPPAIFAGENRRVTDHPLGPAPR